MLVRFLVQGSAEDPYVVEFKREGPQLTASCSCPAGEIGQYCKHRLQILAGEMAGIVDGSQADVDRVLSMLPGTSVEQALQSVNDAEVQLEKAKKHLAGTKKKLARALSGD